MKEQHNHELEKLRNVIVLGKELEIKDKVFQNKLQEHRASKHNR